MKIISKVINHKKKICNSHVMFMESFTTKSRGLPRSEKGISSFDLYTVHGARILDVSLEIMLSPPS